MMLRVSKVKYLHDYSLQVAFNDGKIKTVDLGDLVRWGGYYFAPLRDIEKFKNVSMDDLKYSICWTNGADLSPNTLYELGVEVKKQSKKPTRKKVAKVSSAPIISKGRVAAKLST